MAANPSSLSSSPHCSLPLNRSISPRFHRTSLNLAFFNNDPPSPRLVSVRAQNPSSESGSGPKMASHLDGTEASSSSSAIDFLTLCHRLKICCTVRWDPKYRTTNFEVSSIEEDLSKVDDKATTKRKGWVNHGIKGPESIADHMYRMALMALIAGDLPGVNRERCIKIAIVHDIAEAIVGDITPSDGVPKQEKSRLEQAALNEMCEVLGGGLRAEEMKELWAEYENNSSIEANLVKDFDKVEMILQALEYETEHGKVLDEFFLSTAGKFQTEIGKSWAAEIISRRNSRLANRPN
ncbi:hypothetical protein TEA_029272 [Camellia sinensis var. sinensis]|uniref:5'-deoxynucleotidase n=1 Tax=Camellia sinensis var. sinensis TaxID=542762 RepID=A0A4S4ET40_CAMSN|nr:hypothetical protein TEA_029272 [Camellia sinensis var. sinensis]